MSTNINEISDRLAISAGDETSLKAEAGCEVKDGGSSKKKFKEVFLSQPRSPRLVSTLTKRAGGSVNPKKAPKVNNVYTISEHIKMLMEYKETTREATEEDTYRVTSLPRTESEALNILINMASIERYYAIAHRHLPTTAAPGGVIDEAAVAEGPVRIRAAMMRAKLQAQKESAQAKAARSGGKKGKRAKASKAHDAYQPTEEEENSILRLEDELWLSRDYMTQLAKPLFDIVTELVNDLGPTTALSALNNAVGEEMFKITSACAQLCSEGLYQAGGGDPPNPSKSNISKAFYYLERAVNLGAHSCLFFIAALYWHPLPSRPPSYTKAAQYLLEAERRGVPLHAIGDLLGHCYAEGIGVERDFHKAVHLYQVGSFDNASNLVYLARLYSEGQPPTIPPDPVKSILTLYIALQHGAKEEDFLLSNFMDMARAYKYGIFVDQDWQKAMDYYYKGAAKVIHRHPPAWMNIETTAKTFYKEAKEHESAMKGIYRPNPDDILRTRLKMLLSSSRHHSPYGDPLLQSLVNAQIGKLYMYGKGCTMDTTLAYDYLVKALPNVDAFDTMFQAFVESELKLNDPNVLYDHLELTLKHVNDTYQNDKQKKIRIYLMASAMYASPNFDLLCRMGGYTDTERYKEAIKDRVNPRRIRRGERVKDKVEYTVGGNSTKKVPDDELRTLVNSTADDNNHSIDNVNDDDELDFRGGRNDVLGLKYCDYVIALGETSSWSQKAKLYFSSPDPKVRNRYKAVQSFLTAERFGIKEPEIYLRLGQAYVGGGKDSEYYRLYATEEEKKGPTVPRDLVKARHYLKLAINTGDQSIKGKAWRSLGMTYFSRYARHDNEDPAEAIICYNNAISLRCTNDVYGQLGYMYTYGLGVQRNFERAFDYFMLSARGGFEASEDLLQIGQEIGDWLPPIISTSCIPVDIYTCFQFATLILLTAEKAARTEEEKKKATEAKIAMVNRFDFRRLRSAPEDATSSSSLESSSPELSSSSLPSSSPSSPSWPSSSSSSSSSSSVSSTTTTSPSSPSS